VANAGVGAYGPLTELSPEHLDEMIDVNVKGVLYAAAAAVPHLMRAGGGDFVSVASEAGRRGLPNEAVYCASKFAQVGFTRALANVTRLGDRVLPEPQVVTAARGEAHPDALRMQRAGNGGADAAARTRDNGDLSLQVHGLLLCS